MEPSQPNPSEQQPAPTGPEPLPTPAEAAPAGPGPTPSAPITPPTPAAPAAPPNPPAPPAPASSIPTTADDVDVIEKEWVDAAQKVVHEHADDPHEEEEGFETLQVDYLKKRYGKDIKKPSD